MRTPIAILTLAAVGVTASPATAQIERYELGQRLKRFEADWETADAAGRSRALVAIRPLTRQYLTFQYGEAARTLDDARFALRTTPPTDAERWFAALAVIPEKRLVDAKSATLKVVVRAFYTVAGRPPNGQIATLHIGQGTPVGVPLGKLPTTVSVPFPQLEWEGDQLLWLDGDINGVLEPGRTIRVSTMKFVERARASGEKPYSPFAGLGDLDKFRAGIEVATLQDIYASIAALRRGETPETDVAAYQRMIEAVTILLFGTVGSRFYAADAHTPSRIAEEGLRITVPTAGGKLTPCRVLAPPKFHGPTPVVVALHGMGGSENLFFEGYGAGCVRKACEKRGWMLVCPRSASGFLGGPPPVTDILDKLAERYPIDKSRVFLMGHSMGAAQTVELAQAKPGAFAAVAALGGGGRVRKPEAFAGLPTFVGVGTEDFARGGATGLAKTLADAGVKTVTLKEYPGVEHTLVVRFAVDDVFAAFDKAAAKP